MQFKTIENLSDYLITERGGVIVKSTSELLPTPDKLGYALRVDEETFLPVTKKKVRLIRRFSVEDIKKLFASPKAADYNEEPTVVVTPVEPNSYKKDVKSKKGELEVVAGTKEHPFKVPYVIYENVPYASARKASAETGVSVNTLLRRCKENKDGNYYITA